MSLHPIELDPSSDIPLYRQVADSIARLIDRTILQAGERLPATRELAGQLGVNRTTVSAAYSLLEERGVIEGQVGRGSFVSFPRADSGTARQWDAILPPASASVDRVAGRNATISFASSRPADDDFPLAEFRTLAKQVIDGPDAPGILQLGSSRGYAPLRNYLLTEGRREGVVRTDDDLIITNGCQQGLDLLARLLVQPGTGVAIEDPVYHGSLRVFSRSRAELFGVPVDGFGMMPDALGSVLERNRPRLLVVTPSFQNPTGSTMPVERRQQIISLAHRYGCILIENDIYSALHYTVEPLPTLKQLDGSGNTILLRSYSKVAFPGLRVGWVVAPWPVVARLAEAKEISDLHSDHLSQAVLLRFAESGELESHLERTRAGGAERLRAVLDACARCFPQGTRWTTPAGGMSLWLELPAPLTADNLLLSVQEKGVDFLPGQYFSVRGTHIRCLRISFGGLKPLQIARGIQILGQTAWEQFSASNRRSAEEPAPALV